MNVSIFVFSTLTFRYVAICKPFLSHTMSKLSRAYKFILVSVFVSFDYFFTHVCRNNKWSIKKFQVIWMISICLAVPQVSLILLWSQIISNGINYPFSIFRHYLLFTLTRCIWYAYQNKTIAICLWFRVFSFSWFPCQ